MPTTYSAVVGGNARMKAVWTESLTDTHLNVSVWFYLQMVNGGSSNGTWGASWWGYWNGSNNVPRNIGANGESLVVSGSYSIPRTTVDQSTYFAASAGSYWGTPGHHFNLTIPGKPTVPGAPFPVSGTPSEVTSTSMMYQFSGTTTGGSAITGWEFQYATNAAFTGATTVVSSGTSVVTGLTPKTMYYFRARGKNAIGWSAWSTVVSRETLDIPGPSIPSLVSTSSTSMTVKHTDPAYTGGSILERRLEVGLDSSFSVLNGWTDRLTASFTVTRARVYYLRSRVRNSAGWGPWSETVQVITNSEIPSAPAGYAAIDIASTTAYTTTPSVTDTGGTAIVNVRAQGGLAPTEAGSQLVEAGSYRGVFFEGLTFDTPYYFRLAVQNTGVGGGWSAYGPWVQFKTRNDVPTPPASFTASLVSDSTAQLLWTAPANLLGSELFGYTLRVSTSPAFSTALRTIQLPVTPRTTLVDGLEAGTTYYFQLRANSSNGPGSYSPVISLLTPGGEGVYKDSWLKVAGVWRNGSVWLKVNGIWRRCIVWRRQYPNWETLDGTQQVPSGPQPTLPGPTTFPGSTTYPTPPFD